MQGVIEVSIGITVNASSTATMQDIFDCNSYVATYIQPLANWVPNNGYRNVTDFLKTDQPYTANCKILHMRKPNWDNNYYGWMCPYYSGLYGATGAGVRVGGSFALALAKLLIGLFAMKTAR